jgi:DNA-binding beta-propeller fold protein YncE
VNITRARRRTWIIRASAALAAAALCLAPASPALASSTAASAAPASMLTASASTLPNGDTISFSYSTPAATVNSTNWIGIYLAGQSPSDGSIDWQYAPGASGTLTFSSIDLYGVASYTAYYLYDNGYQVLAGPVSFSIVPSQPAPAPSFRQAFHGLGPSALADPYGIAIGQHGNVWVTDRTLGRVEEFTQSGRPITAFGGQGAGALLHPVGIAVAPDGNIWVADTGHDRIVEFSPRGTELTTIGSPGSASGELDNPQDLAIAPDGDIYVADQGNNRIEEFSSSGSYLASIAVATPYGVALDSSGDIWVASPSYADGNAVYEFSPSGLSPWPRQPPGAWRRCPRRPPPCCHGGA